MIGWLYLLPQLQGAGLALTTLTGLPAWSGIAGAGVVVLLTVVGGGMRSITFVQAFQYWLKLTALAVPALVVRRDLHERRPHLRPAGAAAVPDRHRRGGAHRRRARRDRAGAGAGRRQGGRQQGAGRAHLDAGPHEVDAGTTLEFAAGSAVPTAAGAPTTDRQWLEPMSGGAADQLLSIYSILVAGFLGTMGLPHVLVRFYTNPDGRAARRTTVIVLAHDRLFYMLVTLLGALSRLYTPQLLVSGETDAAVLLVPTAVLGHGWAGWLLGGAGRRGRRGGVPVHVVRARRQPGGRAVHRRAAGAVRPTSGSPPRCPSSCRWRSPSP